MGSSFYVDEIVRTEPFRAHSSLISGSLTDARLKNTIFQHDERGQRTRKTYHDGSFEAWTYDAGGNPDTYTTPGGQNMTVSYDDRDRPN